MGKITYVLFEAASGYSLFEVDGGDDAIATILPQVQESVLDFGKFGALCQLKAFTPFASAEDALTNINDLSEGICSETLHTFLEMNLPKVKEGKKAKFQLGVIEPNVGKAIQDSIGVACVSNDAILEIIRGIRFHFTAYVKQLSAGGFEKAQLGLGHSYSRARVKFNVNRADNMIIQSISLLDQLDKDINTNAMRVREWYSWHFPELARIVKDNTLFARIAAFIGARSSLTEEGKLEGLTRVTMDEDLSKEIVEASNMSMGMDISEIDLININRFTSLLVSLVEYRAQLGEYLSKRMDAVAPNLAALIGDSVAARLISHAGSLTNLSKCPASTVQILGAEKALFRALKTKGNTPKYGLIFHSSFIGRAGAKNKGRISRYLANKCSMAARIDCFSDEQTRTYGEAMKEQVEERLAFYDSGATPKKNIDVMKKVSDSLAVGIKRKRDDTNDGDEVETKKAKKEKKKKDKKETSVEAAPVTEEAMVDDSEDKKEKKKKKKKDKKKEE